MLQLFREYIINKSLYSNFVTVFLKLCFSDTNMDHQFKVPGRGCRRDSNGFHSEKTRKQSQRSANH